MGHRAIVLYELSGTGTYNAHYSHWGAHDLELATKLSRDEPWGGEKSEPEGFTQMLAVMTEAAGDDMEVGGYAAEATETTEVDPDPLACGVTLGEAFEEIVDAVHHEAIFVVRPDRESEEFDVTAYRPISISIPGEPHQGSEDVEFLAFKPRWVDDEPVSLDRRRGIATGMKKTLGALSGEDGVVSRVDVETIWPDLDGGLTAEADVGEIIKAAQAYAEPGSESLFTYGAARLFLTRLFLADFEDSLSEYVSPHSTAIDEELWEVYTCAFLEMTGRTRVLGEMHPTGISAEPWEYPDSFPFPQSVNR